MAAKKKTTKKKTSSNARLRNAIAAAGKKKKGGRRRSGSGKVGAVGYLMAGGAIMLNQPLVHFVTNKTRLFDQEVGKPENKLRRFQPAADTLISTGLAAGELAIFKKSRKLAVPTLVIGGLLTGAKLLQGVSDWMGDALDDATKSDTTKAKYPLRANTPSGKKAAEDSKAVKAPEKAAGTVDSSKGFAGLPQDPANPGTGMLGLDEDLDQESELGASMAGQDPTLWKWAGRMAA